MKRLIDYKSKFRLLKGGKVSLVISAMLGGATITFASPSGGTVVSGSANIAQNGTVTNITQSTSKASINWQNFSIASNETVNFNQPNASSITLNRVIGNERSVINGALNANGQVWLLNSNGVLFGKNASVNTAGILATTAKLSDTDFQAGNYIFTDATSNSIINEGTITISDAGSVILASNELRNSGMIKAVKGKVYLVGADSYTINLNGNSLVNLKVDKGVLDAMVENSGTILADGGEIYLTTNAVDELLKGVVNNTGIIEANSLDGLTGYVELFAHGGTVQIGGTITALDGFVETSGKYFDFLGADIQAGEWMIDPVNVTIDAPLADAIGTALNTGDVTITTDGSNTPNTSSGQSGSDGDITVNSAITKSSGAKTKLTLAAQRDISVNAIISGSNGSPLDIVLASRYKGGVLGGVYVGNDLKSYGGDITIGGGNLNASDFAITHSSTPYGQNVAGVFIGKQSNEEIIIDATDDASASVNDTMSTATTGGNIAIRGKGDTNIGHQSNSGVYFYINRKIGVVTGGDGSIYIEGHGGKSNAHFWDVGAIGVNLESSQTYIKANNGDVVIKGYAGIDFDRFGISSISTFIGTNGYLNISGDSYMIRGGVVNLNVEGSADVEVALLGSGTYSIEKNGNGVLNISGDAKEWSTNKPSGTSDTSRNGTFDASESTINLVNLTEEEALYAFTSIPTTQTVTESTATPLNPSTPQYTKVIYSLSDILAGYTYSGSEITLNSLWNTANIFDGTTYDNWVYGTDYNFMHAGNSVTGFSNAGTYADIYIDILKSGFTEASEGNTLGKFVISKKEITAITGITASDKTYDGLTSAVLNTVNAAFTGIVTNDSLSVATSTGTFSDKNVGSSKTVSITDLTLKGTDKDNYSLSTTTASTTATINKKAITVSGLTAGDKIYDGDTEAVVNSTSASFDGKIGEDSISIASVSGTFDNKNVGEDKTVTLTTIYSGEDAANYTFTDQESTSAEITKKAITVTVNDTTKVFNKQEPSFTYKTTGLVKDDKLSGKIQREEGNEVGIYDILLGSLANPNYEITFQKGQFQIYPDVEKEITVIANTNVVQVSIPKVTLPVVQPQSIRTPVPTTNLGIGENTKTALVSKPLENEPTKVMTLSEIKASQPQRSDSTQEQQGTPVVEDVRVALSQDSIIDLLNGGVNLPEGVDQQFYVVEDKTN